MLHLQDTPFPQRLQTALRLTSGFFRKQTCFPGALLLNFAVLQFISLPSSYFFAPSPHIYFLQT